MTEQYYYAKTLSYPAKGKGTQMDWRQSNKLNKQEVSEEDGVGRLVQ